jgi:outer membrane protein TolC
MKQKFTKQKSVLLIVMGVMLISNRSFSQTSFTLQQAIDYGYLHSSKLQNAILDEKITEEKIKVFRGSGMPQIKASAETKYFPYVPTNVIPNFIAPSVAGVLNGVDEGQVAQGKPRLFFPNEGAATAAADPNNYPLIAAQFGTKYNTAVSANASWLVADASYFLALKAQKELIQLMKYSTERSKLDVAEQISKAYYTTIITEKKYDFLVANIQRIKKTLDDAKESNKQGFVEKLDVDRLQLAYNNLITQETIVKTMVDISYSVLKFQIGYSSEQNISLVDTLNSNQLKTIAINSNFNVESRLEIQQVNKGIELTKLQLKARDMAWMPNLVAFGSYSTTHAANKLDFMNKKANYYTMGVVGLSVNATIFDGLQNKHEKAQLKMKIKQYENSLHDAKIALNLDYKTTATILKNSILSIESQVENLELANEVNRVSKIKYQEGVGSNLELLTAETSLKEAQTSYLSALYDAYIAKVNFEKATGTLVK